jgi:phosphate transport system permease protein
MCLGLALIGGAVAWRRIAPDFRARNRVEDVLLAMLLAASTIAILTTIGIVLSVLFEAIRFFREVPITEFLFGLNWSPQTAIRSDQVGSSGSFGAVPLFTGTLLITAIAMFVSVPVGLMTAIYLAEYASPRVRKVLKPSLEILAGIPSVVLGFFAISFIAPSVVQNLFTEAPIFTLLSAGIGVGILSIPLVASVSEDALRSVPNSLREASYGIGARKITTTLRVVVPAAVSGLVAAVILAVSRAIGETMVVFIAAGAGGNAVFQWSPLEPGLTMTAAMASQATGTDAVVGEALTFQSLFFVGAVLFLITLVLNGLASRFVRRVQHRY